MQAATSGEPVMYCRHCGYILDHLAENRCPECGRHFDPDDPRTYLSRARRSLRRRLMLTPLILLPFVAIASWMFRPTTPPVKSVRPPNWLSLNIYVQPDGSGATPDGKTVYPAGTFPKPLRSSRFLVPDGPDLRLWDKPGKWMPADIVEPRR
jgi:hypothetical protein